MFRRSLKRLYLYGGLGVVAAGILLGLQQTPPPAEAQSVEPPKPAEYVGSETCQACHEDIYKTFQKNPHFRSETQKNGKWTGKACESCHGMGSLHAESVSPDDIRHPGKLAASAADKLCLQCHVTQPGNAGRMQNSHAVNQVSCVGCHPIHQPQTPAGSVAAALMPATGKVTGGPNALAVRSTEMVPRKPASVNALCASCHTNVWADFQKPHAHNLSRNAMSCVDCHNPHGGFFPKNVQAVAGNQAGCAKCHGDKQGPFVFEHAPMRLEGCNACHEPHGSANPRMLTRAEVRFVCLECHSNIGSPAPVASGGTLGGIPPAFHDLRSPRYQNCTLCHIKVHGSNVDRGLTR